MVGKPTVGVGIGLGAASGAAERVSPHSLSLAQLRQQYLDSSVEDALGIAPPGMAVPEEPGFTDPWDIPVGPGPEADLIPDLGIKLKEEKTLYQTQIATPEGANAVKQEQLRLAKSLQTMTAAAGVAQPGGLGMAVPAKWRAKALATVLDAAGVKGLSRRLIEAGINPDLILTEYLSNPDNPPLPYEAQVVLNFGTGAVRGFTELGTGVLETAGELSAKYPHGPFDIAKPVTKAIAKRMGRDPDRAIEDVEFAAYEGKKFLREEFTKGGFKPSKLELEMQAEMPVTKGAMDIGKLGGRVGFALGVQMPIIRSMPGMTEVAAPVANFFGKFKTPWISANAGRIAQNMLVRGIANVSHRAAVEAPYVVSGQQRVDDYLYHLALTGAFTMSEVIPEMIPSPLLNVGAQTLHGGVNNVAQDLLEGRQPTWKSFAGGAFMNLMYGIDDAIRVRGITPVFMEMKPVLDDPRIAPEIKASRIQYIANNAVASGKLAQESLPVVMKFAQQTVVGNELMPGYNFLVDRLLLGDEQKYRERLQTEQIKPDDKTVNLQKARARYLRTHQEDFKEYRKELTEQVGIGKKAFDTQVWTKHQDLIKYMFASELGAKPAYEYIKIVDEVDAMRVAEQEAAKQHQAQKEREAKKMGDLPVVEREPGKPVAKVEPKSEPGLPLPEFYSKRVSSATLERYDMLWGKRKAVLKSKIDKAVRDVALDAGIESAPLRNKLVNQVTMELTARTKLRTKGVINIKTGDIVTRSGKQLTDNEVMDLARQLAKRDAEEMGLSERAEFVALRRAGYRVKSKKRVAKSDARFIEQHAPLALYGDFIQYDQYGRPYLSSLEFQIQQFPEMFKGTQFEKLTFTEIQKLKKSPDDIPKKYWQKGMQHNFGRGGEQSIQEAKVKQVGAISGADEEALAEVYRIMRGGGMIEGAEAEVYRTGFGWEEAAAMIRQDYLSYRTWVEEGRPSEDNIEMVQRRMEERAEYEAYENGLWREITSLGDKITPAEMARFEKWFKMGKIDFVDNALDKYRTPAAGVGEDPFAFEAPQKSFWDIDNRPPLPPKGEDLKVRGKGKQGVKADEAQRVQEAQGQTRAVGKGVADAEKAQTKLFDNKTYAKLLEKHKKSMPTEKASEKAFMEARIDAEKKRLEIQSVDTPTLRKLQKALDILGVPEARKLAFIAEYNYKGKGIIRAALDAGGTVKEIANRIRSGIEVLAKTTGVDAEVLIKGDAEAEAKHRAIAEKSIEQREKLRQQETDTQRTPQMVKSSVVEGMVNDAAKTTLDAVIPLKRIEVSLQRPEGKPETELFPERIKGTGVEPKVVVHDAKTEAELERMDALMEERFPASETVEFALDSQFPGRLPLERALLKFTEKRLPVTILQIKPLGVSKYNDTKGYKHGDGYLSNIVDALNAALPKSAQIGKWGPELRVTVVLPQGAKSAYKTAIKIVNEVKKTYKGEGEVAIGMATNGGEVFKATIREANQHLLLSHRLGRNLIVNHEVFEESSHVLQEPRKLYELKSVTPTEDLEVKVKEEGKVMLHTLTVNGASDVGEIARQITSNTQEKLYFMFADESDRILGLTLVGLGDARKVTFSEQQAMPAWGVAMKLGAKKMWVLHNHPVGDPKPTEADMIQYENLRRVSSALGIDFAGGVAVGKYRYSVVEPAGTILRTRMGDINEEEAKYAVPILGAEAKPMNAMPLNAENLVGYVSKTLKGQEKGVYAIMMGEDLTPRGVYYLDKDMSKPHEMMEQIARLAASTSSSRVALSTADDPGKWAANLGILHYDLKAYFGIDLEQAVSPDGRTFSKFKDNVPAKQRMNDYYKNVPEMQSPVEKYDLGKTDPVNTELAVEFVDLVNHAMTAKSNAFLKGSPKTEYEAVEVGEFPVSLLHLVQSFEYRTHTAAIDEARITEKAWDKVLYFLTDVMKLQKPTLWLSMKAGRSEKARSAREDYSAKVGKFNMLLDDLSTMFVRHKLTPDEWKMVQYAMKDREGKVEFPKELLPAVTEGRKILMQLGIEASKIEVNGKPLLDPKALVYNFGKYLPRMYEAFETYKSWKKTKLSDPEEKDVNKFADWLVKHAHQAKELTYEEKKKRNPKMTEAELEVEQYVKGSGFTKETARSYAFALVNNKALADAPLYFSRGKGDVRLDLRRFKQRKKVPKAVREFLGEITYAPGYLTAKGGMQLGRDIATAGYFQKLEMDKQSILSPKEYSYIMSETLKGKSEKMRRKIQNDAERYWRKLPNDPKLGTLAGKYARMGVYDDVMGLSKFQKNVDDEMKRWGKRAMALWKTFKVTGSPPTVIRNTGFNAIGAEAFGDLPVPRLDVYAKTISDFMSHSDVYKAERNVGMFERTFAKQELDYFYKSMKGAKSLADLKGKAQNWFRNVVNGVGVKAPMAAGKAYGMVEDFFKGAVFRWHYVNMGESAQRANEAAQRALFDYGAVPPWIRSVREHPLGAPFVTFPYKFFPALTKAMVRKPLTVMKWLLLPSMITAYSLRELGVSREEWEKIKKQMPWSRRLNPLGSVLLPNRDKYDRLTVWDGTFYLPWVEPIAEGMGTLPSMFMGGNPAYQLTNTVAKFTYARASGKPPVDDYFGMPIWRDTDTEMEKTGKAIKYIAKQLGPSWMPVAGTGWEKVARAAVGKEDWIGRKYTMGEALAYNLGQKLIMIDEPEVKRQGLTKMRSSINKQQSNISKLENDLKALESSPTAKERAKKRVKRDIREAYKAIDSYVEDLREVYDLPSKARTGYNDLGRLAKLNSRRLQEGKPTLRGRERNRQITLWAMYDEIEKLEKQATQKALTEDRTSGTIERWKEKHLEP